MTLVRPIQMIVMLSKISTLYLQTNDAPKTLRGEPIFSQKYRTRILTTFPHGTQYCAFVSVRTQTTEGQLADEKTQKHLAY